MSALTLSNSAIVAEARRLAEAGWTRTEISRLLGARGFPIHRTTVARWIDSDLAERRRERNRNAERMKTAERTTGRLGVARHSEDFRFRRMVALREAGLSFSAIAKAMNFDYPDMDVNEEKVRYRLNSSGVLA